MVVHGRFERQEMHLEAARLLCVAGPVDDLLFDLVRENLVMDPASANELIPYFDAMPDEIASAVAAAIADMEAATPLLRVYDGPHRGTVQAARIGRVLEPVTRSLRRARERLAPFATGKGAADLMPATQNLVVGMQQLAESARDLRSGVDVD
ncbi:hypothetical protein ARC20_03390 [Stenotrophomonas panacihumi]|uniref:Uncharacterized protein n=2 Tax=Stenotrophomonas panacihumi TaxID=676599 RepID=A0A0R0ARU2_9GAMM|nr:hypothetical protein ARC20_03390 [Stenotrophomonas panacihumi]PTN55863.1 hypothetical protein C9J98_04630 [Stenotrophomonas panacihumi]